VVHEMGLTDSIGCGGLSELSSLKGSAWKGSGLPAGCGRATEWKFRLQLRARALISGREAGGDCTPNRAAQVRCGRELRKS